MIDILGWLVVVVLLLLVAVCVVVKFVPHSFKSCDVLTGWLYQALVFITMYYVVSM